MGVLLFGSAQKSGWVPNTLPLHPKTLGTFPLILTVLNRDTNRGYDNPY